MIALQSSQGIEKKALKTELLLWSIDKDKEE
jgi:hypothetical protein